MQPLGKATPICFKRKQAGFSAWGGAIVAAQQVAGCVAELPQGSLLSDYVLREEWLQPLACAWRKVCVACGTTLALGPGGSSSPATS